MATITVGKTADIMKPNQMTFEERENELERQKQAEQEQLKREKNSPYRNFYQFNKEHSKDMIKLAGKYPKSHQILLFLLDQMDNYNAVVCSYKVLCEALEMSDSTAKRAVKVLKENGFISIFKSGTANVYAVNKNLAWNSWGKNFKYAKFDAKIIIAESEQDREEPEITTEKLKQVNIKKKKETA